MEMLKGEKLRSLPFRELKKVSDLIYFDGPILSHFTDSFGKNILFYWVDYNDKFNRWVVFQISENQLGDFLLKQKTLNQIFQEPLNDIFYTVEIGDKLEFKNVLQIFKGDLLEEYIPEVNSTYAQEPPLLYKSLLRKYEDKYAKVIFFDSSLYIKAEPAAKDKTFNLVGVLDGADFLYGIGNSFKGLIEYEAAKEFLKRGISDRKRIKSAVDSLVKSMQPNMIELKAASFAVALSPNSYTEVGEKFLGKKWRDELFDKFKNDILEIDKKDTQEVDEILQSYGQNDTYEIYKPLIELYNNKRLVINITDKEFRPQRTIRPVKKELAEKLTKRREKEKEEPQERIAKVKYNVKTNRMVTLGATLFDQSISTSWKTKEIRTEKKIYKLRHDIIADYKIENKLHILNNDELDIYATGDSLPEAETNFNEEFDRVYKDVYETDNLKLLAYQIEFKRYLHFHMKG